MDAFRSQPEVRPHAVFLSDYDMLLTEHLAQGVDVWINTPRRPWEASGTSGMKVLVNGGLNLWMAGGRRPTPLKSAGPWGTAGSMTRTRVSVAKADALYGLLEREVIPEFYAATSGAFPRLG